MYCLVAVFSTPTDSCELTISCSIALDASFYDTRDSIEGHKGFDLLADSCPGEWSAWGTEGVGVAFNWLNHRASA